MWPADPTCSACGEPVRPGEWYRAVVIDRAGTRAHLACLEERTPPADPDAVYLLARRTTSPDLLAPGARFVALGGDSVLIAVPVLVCQNQSRRLLAAGVGNGEVYPYVTSALAAARGGGADLVTAPLPAEPPTAPQNVRYDGGGFDLAAQLAWAVVRWDGPDGDPAGPVASYRVTWYSNALTMGSGTTAVPRARLDGLVPGVFHRVYVQAVGPDGQESPQSPVCLFTSATP